MVVRTLNELVNRDEPALVTIRGWIRDAIRPVEVLAVEQARGEEALLALQVTTRSPLGALAYETGGLLVDGGYVRVLGGGGGRIKRGIDTWNGLPKPAPEQRLPGALLVGDDVMGGFFAVNGGGLNGEPGDVFYFAPDSLSWEDLEMGHSDWLRWLFVGDLDTFYEPFRWSGNRDECAEVGADEVLSVYPPLVFADGAIGDRSRRAVPIAEHWRLSMDLAAQLVDVGDGQRVRVVFTE